MGGEECDVVGDRLFNPFFFDGQVRKIAVLEFRALPGDRGKVGRWREQLLRNRLAPFFDQCVPLAIISRGERSTVADPAFLGERECAAPLDARRPVVRNTAGMAHATKARWWPLVISNSAVPNGRVLDLKSSPNWLSALMARIRSDRWPLSSSRGKCFCLNTGPYLGGCNPGS